VAVVGPLTEMRCYVLPVLCMTSCYSESGTTRIVHHVRQMAADGTKSAVTDCMLFVTDCRRATDEMVKERNDDDDDDDEDDGGGVL